MYYVFTYHIPNSSFTQLKFNDSTRSVYDFSYSSINNRIVHFGSISSQISFVVDTHFDSILDIEDINEDTTTIFNIANLSNYQLSSVTNNSPANGSDFVSDGSSLVSVSKTMNITMDQYSDLVFFLDTPTNSEFYSLVENWNTTLSI